MHSVLITEGHGGDTEGHGEGMESRAMAVNDLYRPYVNPRASDRQLLRAARISAVAVTILGIALVPIFTGFKTIYEAHGAMTAAVTPPLVVALMLVVFWRRYTAAAALATIAGGLLAIIVSVFVPEIIAPFAHGVPFDADYRSDGDAGLFAGARQYKFMRALFGLSASAGIGIVVTLFTRPEPVEKQRGLVWGTIADAIRHYKGAPGSERASTRATARPRRADVEPPRRGDACLAVVSINRALADALDAGPGDLVYVSDARRWLGGLRYEDLTSTTRCRSVTTPCRSHACEPPLATTHPGQCRARRHGTPLG